MFTYLNPIYMLVCAYLGSFTALIVHSLEETAEFRPCCSSACSHVYAGPSSPPSLVYWSDVCSARLSVLVSPSKHCSFNRL